MSLINRDEVAGRETERAEGERSEAAGGGAPPEAVPDPELTERPKRRSFSAEYKLKVLKEADACKESGEVGALLRREGLYSSHLSSWRRQRDAGELGRKRGRKGADPLETENADLRRRAERAEAELAKARKVIEVQGNVSALLEDLLGTEGAEESTER
jgi:transposase-like protein